MRQILNWIVDHRPAALALALFVAAELVARLAVWLWRRWRVRRGRVRVIWHAWCVWRPGELPYVVLSDVQAAAVAQGVGSDWKVARVRIEVRS
jgi:hypothetical protein